MRHVKKRSWSEDVNVRLLGFAATFGKEQVFIMDEGHIKDMLNGMDKEHPLNRALVAFLELMQKEMFLAQ